jgi:NAD(P)H-hydrate epimerase
LIGCGIGTEYENDLRDILINADSPIIIDAVGINFLSKNIDIIEQIPTSLIITPHPKEMARLCGCSVSQIQENRFSKCKEFSEKYGCTVVLKGAGTIIFTPNQTPIINENGNSGLSKGGSGDVLAGMISAFVAQGVTPHYASALGVYLHGLAADALKKSFSEFSFLPSDIPKEVGKILAEKLL